MNAFWYSARISFIVLAGMLLGACGGPIMPASALSDRAGIQPLHSKIFHYTGAAQEFVVPRGVTQITIDANGAAGDGCISTCGPGSGGPGHGGRVYAVVPVTPGETMYVYVGGQASGLRGGFNGGGDGSPGGFTGYGGGGATDVREGRDTLAHRILVAGGGGGSSYVERNAIQSQMWQGWKKADGDGRAVIKW